MLWSTNDVPVVVPLYSGQLKTLMWVWHCAQIKSLTEDKKKLEGDVNVLDKKVKDVVKGQGSRDVLIDTLQGKMQELQRQIDDDKVNDASSRLAFDK